MGLLRTADRASETGLQDGAEKRLKPVQPDASQEVRDSISFKPTGAPHG